MYCSKNYRQNKPTKLRQSLFLTTPTNLASKHREPIGNFRSLIYCFTLLKFKPGTSFVSRKLLIFRIFRAFKSTSKFDINSRDEICEKETVPSTAQNFGFLFARLPNQALNSLSGSLRSTRLRKSQVVWQFLLDEHVCSLDWINHLYRGKGDADTCVSQL